MSRVLVVEDEAHLAQGLRFNLEAEGYSAEVVGDGEAATDRLLNKKENFDASRARHYAARQRWVQRGFRITRGAELCAGADADRSRAARRCAERFCRGSGRLFAQAFRFVHPFGPLAGTAAAESMDARQAGRARTQRRRRLIREGSATSEHFLSVARPSTSARLNCARPTMSSTSR